MSDRVAAIELECRLLRWGDSSTAGRTVTFELDPDAGEQHPFRDYLAGARNGTRFRLLYAPIGDDESSPLPPVAVEAPTPATSTVHAPARPKNPEASARGLERYLMSDDGEKAVIRAGILCKDPRFWRWQEHDLSFVPGRIADLETSADFLRIALNIRSRRELAADESAYRAFRDIEFEFHGHAEQRG